MNPTERPPAGATGTFEKTPFSHLLLYVADKRLTGTLEIATADRRSAAVYFVEGRPVKARTSEPVVYLGRVLLERGAITEEQLNRSLAELANDKAKGRRLHGELLLTMGLLDKPKLQAGLREQLTRKLRYLATLPADTAYAYYEQFDSLAGWGGIDHLPIEPMPLVWSILRSDPPEEQMRATLARLDVSTLRIARGADLERFGLTDQERTAVDLVRAKPMRIGELAAVGVLSERAARVLAYSLLATKQVELVRPTDAPDRASAPPVYQTPVYSTPPRQTPSRQSPPRVMSSAPPVYSTPPRAMSSNPPVPPSGRGSDALKQAMGAVSSRPPKRSPVPAGGPGGGPPPSLAPELAERWKEIVDRAATIDRADYFMMLDVARDATQDDIETSFFGLAKRWHPDRLPAELAPVRDACSRVFARMSEAHVTLGDKEKRERYMKLLADGSGTPEAQEHVAKAVEAAQLFQKAEICFKRNDLVQAEALCLKAAEDDPTQAEYLAMLAWLTSLKPENQSRERTAECIKLLDKAVSLSERCEKAYFWRGMLHKRNGNERSALRDFEQVTELNPRNIDAAREVRLFAMRSTGKSPKIAPARSTPVPQGADKGGGLFGKLFKK